MSDQDEARPPTPDGVKRILRQRAGFGCCLCGLPILQYHHIIEWSVEEHFRPDDMMALCPTHHDMATKGAYPLSEQRRDQASPFNIQRRLARGLLAVKQDYPAIELGSVLVVNNGPILSIDEEQVIGLSIAEGAVGLSLKLYSEDGPLLCQIDENEWVSGNPFAWDIVADWQILTIRQKKGSVNLSLNAKLIPMKLTGSLWFKSKEIKITEKKIRFVSTNNDVENLAFARMSLSMHENGISLVPNGKGMIMGVGVENRRERLWKTVGEWRKLKDQAAR
ncbi:HNH endonuclease signature motif containing protein [Mesorhizobium helmanticense]|uniref:HNH nuclease domain-containing protein n=1 Tax=Mesorhizobium helmanticense TaxID=1776423 RepID=A0A2T4IP41_9HYPH|nr:HNH endonuclease signature motif containing protein [Mesorhizobium helmanticense]PTE07388.1 hypothetical protein C9427_27195 [Mesorhizobium helmanticense]